MKIWTLSIVAALLCGATFTPTAFASVVSFDAPDLDRWMYPFNGTPGSRTNAPVFGAVGTEGFDDRDGQLLLGFDLSDQVLTGQGAENYRVESVTLTVRHTGEEGFLYDPTYDSYKTYLDSSDADYQADADAGRPVGVFGAGFRNLFERLAFTADASPESFNEGDAFGGVNGRNVFAAGFDAQGDLIDVSNNVEDRFEADPWAVGANTGLVAGQSVSGGTDFTFELDVSDGAIQEYLRGALDAGRLGLMVASLHPASQPGTGGSAAQPRFHTKESFHPSALPARLEVEYTLAPAEAIPTPTAAAGGLILLGVLAARRRRLRPVR